MLVYQEQQLFARLEQWIFIIKIKIFSYGLILLHLAILLLLKTKIQVFHQKVYTEMETYF